MPLIPTTSAICRYNIPRFLSVCANENSALKGLGSCKTSPVKGKKQNKIRAITLHRAPPYRTKGRRFCMDSCTSGQHGPK
jgi:hypothetical protein